MTVAGKIHALVLTVSIAAGTLLTVVAAQREYSVAQETLVKQSIDLVRGQPQLQIAVYFNDQAELEAVLQDLIQSSPAIRFAIVRDAQGSELARRQQENAPTYDLAPFKQARGEISVAEVGFTAHQHKTETKKSPGNC